MSIKSKESGPFMVYDGFVCDKCGREFDGEDFVQEQEGLFITDTGGYGSVWGDGATWSISLCQECAYSLLSPYAKSTGDWIDNLNNDD